MQENGDKHKQGKRFWARIPHLASNQEKSREGHQATQSQSFESLIPNAKATP